VWMLSESDGTEKQLDVIWSQIPSVGQISRNGQVQTVGSFLIVASRGTSVRIQRHLALAHLMDTYIEVDYLQQGEIHSPLAGKLLHGAVDRKGVREGGYAVEEVRASRPGDGVAEV
jgi:hypothetical protein